MVSNAGRKCAGNHTKFVEYCIKSNCPLPEDVVEALKLFNKILLTNIKLNRVTVLIILTACTGLVDLEEGNSVHEYVMQNGFKDEMSIGTDLMVMYAKYGSIEIARQLFDQMSKRDMWSCGEP